MLSLHKAQEKLNTDEGKSEIILAFSKIDYRDYTQADKFFEDNCVGLWNMDRSSIPYYQQDYIGRVNAYQDLLDLIKKSDSNQFSKIHKGTPYCFLGWLFLDIGDYEKAVFYIDLAILEDIRFKGPDWNETPASRLLRLKEYPTDIPIHQRLVKDIERLIKLDIEDYTSFFAKSNLKTTNDFVDKFVIKDLKNPHHRTIVTSLYSFVLQQNSLQNLINKRGEESGSIEPFLIHLRKGAIILETMLKETYSSLSGLTLNKLLNDPLVKKDSGLSLLESGKVGNTLEDVVSILLPYFEKEKNKPQDRWITISYRLRNVTSHGLPWSETIDKRIYKKLYQHILFSIFYLIENKY